MSSNWAGCDPVSSSTLDAEDLRNLACRALCEVRARSVASDTSPVDRAIDWLVRGCAPDTRLDLVTIVQGLQEFDLSVDQLLARAIPRASEIMGNMWLRDEMSFADVTLASSWLMHIVQTQMEEWQPRPPRAPNCLNILVATPLLEQHILGVSVLVRQLRQDGHSVQTLLDATPERIQACLKRHEFQAVFISVGSSVTLDTACELVSAVKALPQINTRVVLGGAAFADEATKVQVRSKLDMPWITNDPFSALVGLVRQDTKTKLMVAE